MHKYIIEIHDPDVDGGPISFCCDSFDDVEAELRRWAHLVEIGITLDVFRFDEETLDYDQIDHIESF